MVSSQMRDEICRQDVGRMAQLGRFGEEFTFYCCAYQEQGRVRYVVSEQPEYLYDQRWQWLRQGRYTTPIIVRSQRLMIPAGMREGLRQGLRLGTARALRETFPPLFLQLLEDFGQTPASNLAYQPLKDLQRRWSGGFDADHLQLYQSLIDQAQAAKQLNHQSLAEFNRWLSRMWEQPGLTDTPREAEQRTFSAFAYGQGTQALGLEEGLPRYKVMIKQAACQQRGYWTTPIFTKTCWFRDITLLKNARSAFRDQAWQYFTGDYLPLTQTLAQLPTVQDTDRFRASLAALRQSAGESAAQALAWYGRLWNVPL